MSDKRPTPPLPTLWPNELSAASPENRWLVEPLWLRSAVGVIVGPPKSYKTWLGLEIATAVSTDTPCLGRFPVRAPGGALVCLAEHELLAVRERLAALANARHRTLFDLGVRVIGAPSLRLDLDDGMRRLAATVRDIRPRLLLLDPLSALHPAAATDAANLASLLSRLRSIQNHYDVAVLLVHHTRPGGRARGRLAAPRDTDDLLAWGDSNLLLDRRDDTVVLAAQHRFTPAPEPVSLSLAGEPPALIAANLDAALGGPILEDRLVEQLRLQDSPVSRRHLSELLGTQDQRLEAALTRLHALGAIRRTPDGWTA